ncbi:MAG TPA: hypothetical protein VFX60_04400 [Micromonospora sp.]|nr:hypothetical protein [Micromonospora sp.]
MTAPTVAVSQPESGTALLRTAVVHAPDGTPRLRRFPGPRAPREFVPVDPVLAERLAEVRTTEGARLALSETTGRVRVYPANGVESVARRLLVDGPVGEMVRPVRALGQLLRELHRIEPPAALVGEIPAGAARLDRWLAGRSADPHAAYAADVVRRRLGPERWAGIRDRFDRLLAESEVVLAHGAPGLGSMIAGTAGADVLLTGEDLCVASWQFDLGWVVGELVELRWQVGGDPQGWQALLNALFEGYGRDLGDEWASLAALRILLHVHDIAAYADWYRAGFDHYASFLSFLLNL